MKEQNLPKIYSEIRKIYARIENWFSRPYSRLYIISDRAGWVLDEEARELYEITKALGIKSSYIPKLDLDISQAVHYTSQFSLLSEKIFKPKNRISIDYFHGKPEQGESFRKCFEALKDNQAHLAKIRVSNSDMESFLISNGIDKDKIMRIPIGINLKLFKPQTEEKKREARAELSIPEDAFVIGSFQKDGVGWTDGLEPKLIKGPDIFLKIIRELKAEIPNLMILLSGPARGYVRKGLDEMDVPYRYTYAAQYAEVSKLYDAIDLYLITSREEGGPKACLEALAKGVPLVTTAVGQCNDLVKNEENGMMSPIEDVESLKESVLRLISDTNLRLSIVTEGLKTAKNNSYEAQAPLWDEYFRELIT